jgi:hypothetical protein
VAAEPVAVPGIKGATALAAAGDHTCARLADGEIRCWGYDIDGRLTGVIQALTPGPVVLP